MQASERCSEKYFASSYPSAHKKVTMNINSKEVYKSSTVASIVCAILTYSGLFIYFINELSILNADHLKMYSLPRKVKISHPADHAYLKISLTQSLVHSFILVYL